VDNLLCASFEEVLKHFRREKGVNILLSILADNIDGSVRIEDKPDCPPFLCATHLLLGERVVRAVVFVAQKTTFEKRRRVVFRCRLLRCRFYLRNYLRKKIVPQISTTGSVVLLTLRAVFSADENTSVHVEKKRCAEKQVFETLGVDFSRSRDFYRNLTMATSSGT
jgi:hypothetical protein